MQDEFIYPSDDELSEYFVTDLYKAFLQEIKKYPVLSIEEQKELARQYKNGDIEARTLLTNHNLRLVAHIAGEYKDKIVHLSVMDIIQEGVLGLMRAIDKYDPEVGALSTYATTWIRQAVTRAIDDCEDEIRKPVNIVYKIRKYNRIRREAINNHLPLPSDDELVKLLDCSYDILEQVKKSAMEKKVSVHTKISDDDDSELGDFIPDIDNNFDEILDDMDSQELLVVLKSVLNPIEYYFLYNYEIDRKSDDVTLEQLAGDFNITRERVRQLKKKAYEKSADYVKDKDLRAKEVAKIEKRLGIPIDRINVRPYDVNEIVLYKALENSLSNTERILLAHLLFSEIKMSNRELANFFKISMEKMDALVKRLKAKMAKYLENLEEFDKEKEGLKETYGTKIFMLVPDDVVKNSFKNLVNRRRDEEIRKEEEEKRKRNEEIILEEKKKGAIFEFVSIDNHDLLVAIKSKLSPLEYYIFYKLLKGKDDLNRAGEKLAKELNSSSNTINTYKDNIAKKLGKMIYSNNFLDIAKTNLCSKYSIPYENLKADPIEPNKIITLAYVQEYLSEMERKILSISIFGPSNIVSNKDLKELGLTPKEYNNIKVALDKKIKSLTSGVTEFKMFKNNMMRTYGTKIFNANFDYSFNDIDYDTLNRVFNSKSFTDIKNLYGEYWNQLDINSQNLLKRYFMVPEDSFTSKEEWEEAFYLELGNISVVEREPHLDLHTLHDCYLKNKDNFNDDMQDFLENYVFDSKDKKECGYDNKYLAFSNYKSLLLDRLERIYFNVHKMFLSFDFTKEHWLKVLEKHENEFSEKRIIAMNMFYGIDGEAMSISEIAEVFDVDYDKMHNFLNSVRKKAIALYTNRATTKDIDYDIYIPYILNKAYDFTDLNRDILKMFLIEKLGYTEIRERLAKRNIDLSNTKISNIVTENMRKIDFYRFGLVDKYSYSEKFIRAFLERYKDKISVMDKQVAEYKYIYHWDLETIEKKLGLDKERIKKIIQRLNLLIDNFRGQDCVLTEKDYLKEFNELVAERVLDERQMLMLSLYFGIRCKYNPKGIKLSVTEMIKKIPEFEKEQVSKLEMKINRANDLVRLKKNENVS